MISQEAKEEIRRVVEAVPARQGHLGEVVQRGRRRRRAIAAGRILVSAALAAGVWGLVGLFVGAPRPVASGPAVRVVEVAPGFEVQVETRTAVSQGWRIYRALPGPSPEFDPSEFGIEIPLRPHPLEDLKLPRTWRGLWSGAGGPSLVYLGDVGGAKIAIDGSEGFPSRDGPLVCWFSTRAGIVDGGECVGSAEDGPEDGPFVGILQGPVDTDVVIWARLLEASSIVVLRDGRGVSYWQRVVGRTVFFDLPADACFAEEPTMLVLDKDGNVIERARPGEVWMCGATP